MIKLLAKIGSLEHGQSQYCGECPALYSGAFLMKKKLLHNPVSYYRSVAKIGTTLQARVFIPPRTTAKTLVAAGHVGRQEFIA